MKNCLGYYRVVRVWAVRGLLILPALLFGGGIHAEQVTEKLSDISVVRQFFSPLEKAKGIASEKIRLGRRLFNDPRLSGNGKISCASCHDVHKGGADGLERAVGVSGKPGAYNTPTVFNSVPNFAYFWDGRVATAEEQIDGPINSPNEMGSNWPAIIKSLSKVVAYRNEFNKIYAGEISEATIKNAIVSFERTLITLNSPFDKYLRGEEQAITQMEKEGLSLFISYGCVACHQGRLVGGNMYQKLGIFHDYFGDRENSNPANRGRFNVSQKKSDMYFFKVPSLRNIGRTAPYMHDGSTESLHEVVRIMAYYQLGVDIKEVHIDKIVQFLYTLTGDTPESSGS